MRSLQTLTLFLVLINLSAACQPTASPEIDLLNYFKTEKSLLTSYQEDYAAYMAYQLNHFTKKQQRSTENGVAI